MCALLPLSLSPSPFVSSPDVRRADNDLSVMEHHHASTAFALMDATNLLADFTLDCRRSLRKLVISASA